VTTSNVASRRALPSPMVYLHSDTDHSYQRVHDCNPWTASASGTVGIGLWFTCLGYVFCFRCFSDAETSQQVALS
jgi:hypothetical protein